MREMSFSFLMRLGRKPGLESPSDQGRGTSEASGAWPGRRSGAMGMTGSGADASAGRCAARRRSGRDRHRGEGRRPPRPGPGRPTVGSEVRRSRRSQALPHRRRVYLRDDDRELTDGVYTLRQRPERPHPGCPEGFRRVLPRRRPGGIAPRYNQAACGLPRSGGTGLF